MGLIPKKKVAPDIRREFTEADYDKDVDEPEEDEFDLSKEPTAPKGKEEDKSIWKVQNVATETQPVIYDSKNKKAYDLHSALAELLNRTEQ